ncbi:MAG: tRNA (guanosine(37)-N1)-methyltransferase TrmD [Patescibacteria group bacterium]|nr:tRNA (guanosine(37)-N1)-methyltransferase TrmD [Patescibacteria group bacterium]
MKISILTLFPEMFYGPFDHSIIKIAKEKKLVEINFVNIRDFGIGKHKIVDDTPYGGGAGMVMRIDVLEKAIKKTSEKVAKQKIVLLDPRGERFNQKKAIEFSKLDHLVLIAGHYEGFDERVVDYVDEVISIGDYVLTGGEIPAMVISDSVVRLIPDVIKNMSTRNESFSIYSDYGSSILEYPQYTKPQIYKKSKVPEVLLSGDHKEIDRWRKETALKHTKKTRPDLLG